MTQTEQKLNVVEHLDELRKRLIISASAFFIFFILAFIYVDPIFSWFVRDLDIKLTLLSPTEIISIYIKIAGVIAILLTIPVIAWQIWLFIKPALKPKEQKITLFYIPALFLLFALGLSFGYFIIVPIVFNFLLALSGELFQTMFTTEKYFKFIFQMSFPFAILFELPVVSMFLTSLGIIDPPKLKRIRKYAYFVLVLVAVTITPPDPLIDFLVVIPLILLYECSIWSSKIVYKKKDSSSDPE